MSVHVLIVPLDSYGHINSCIGVAEKIVKLGHRVTFAIESAWKGKLHQHGFNEVIFIDPSRDPNYGPNEQWIKSVEMIQDTLHEDSLFKAKHQNIDEFEAFVFNELNYDDKLKEIIDNLKPDVIVMDHYFTVPAIYQSGIKWVYMTSATPLSAIFHPDTPPTGSGYPTNSDRKQWQIFIQTSEDHYGKIIKKFNQRLMQLSFPSLPEGSSFHPSPYLNMYAYPEILDYLDIRPLPEKWKRFDHFIRLNDKFHGKFVLPEKFQKLPGKLIYVSMGSMGCSHLKLMKRLVDMLSKSKHRFLMVLGPHHEQLQLPNNICGDRMLPQLDILPMVDLMITHGGNNSVLECLYYGKPMIINPLFYDQYDNAQRVTEKGLGHRINAYTCQPDELLQLIEKTLNDEQMKMLCQQVSIKMKSSNSTLEAAKSIIEVAKMN